MFLPKKILEEKLLRILAEDLGQGDVTSALIASEGEFAKATVIAKESGIAAGIEESKTLLESLGLEAKPEIGDGERFRKNQTIMKVSGDSRTILSSERTVLNIISRMCGIATKTAAMVERLRKAKLRSKVACTRKAAPGLLYFDKKAVALGGGDTHRLHLDDMILIKDNHITIAGGIERAVDKAKEQASFSKKIEVEVTNVRDALTAASMGVDVIMFDNFNAREVGKAVQLIRKGGFDRVILEASGGITSENLLSFASTGVNVVSLGELTAHARGLDVSLKITSTTGGKGRK
jgi:nicotinate-nucleotide pyrophosphorylase (carboxylating)